MTAASSLRDTIIQAALQGNLSEASHSDTDATVTLERITSIRENMIAIGEKRNKILPPIKEKELPFDIPPHWIWVRLNNIYNFIDYRGKTPVKLDEGIRLIGAANIKMGYLNFRREDKFISSEEYETRKSRGETKYGDILLVTEGGTMGCVSLNSYSGKCSCGQRVITLQPYLDNSVSNKLYLFFLMSSYFQNLLRAKKSGSAATGIKADTLKEFLIPFPPFEEQQRIAMRLNELLIKVDELEKIERQLTVLKSQFPLDIQSALLQSALQGELTNRPHYSDVDQLLEDSILQRQKLVQTKVLKNEKIMPLSDNDFPFDIPDEWRFVRLGNIIRLLSGQDFTPDKYFDTFAQGSMPYITGASNMENGAILINRWTNTGKSIAHKGELLLSCKGTVGKMAFLHVDEAHIARQIMAISPLAGNNIKYIAYCIENFVMKLRGAATSMIPGIDRSMILNLVVPLPPIEEQACIVARLDELLPLCNSLTD